MSSPCITRRGQHTSSSAIAIACIAITICVCNFPIATSRAQDDPKLLSSIRYRRIFVPAETPTAWPLESRKFLPIAVDDFNRLVAAANRIAPSRPGAVPAVTLLEAHYAATVSETGELIAPRGTWSFAVRGDQPALFELGEPSFSLHEPSWRGSDVPVRLGRWAKSSATPGALELEVPRAGALDFTWRGSVQQTSDGFEIPWTAPHASITRWTLDLPKNMEPVLESALEISGDSSNVFADSVTGSISNSSIPPRFRRWVLSLPPTQNGNVRIRQFAGETKSSNPIPFFREDVTYHVSERGLELVAIWKFTSPVSHQELEIDLPRGLNLTAVQAAGEDLKWRLAKSGDSDQIHAFVSLPRDVDRAEIEFRAWQESDLGEPWLLPSLRPHQLEWTAGRTTLWIDPALELLSLTPQGYLQTATHLPAAHDDAPQRHDFTAFQESAQLTATLGRAAPSPRVRSATILTTGAPDVSGRLVSQFMVERGRIYSLEGDVPPGWVIESVTTVPANALRDWIVERSDEGGRLSVRLVRALQPARPVTVVVHGRLQRPNIYDSFSAQALALIHWRNAEQQKRSLALQVDPSIVPQATGAIRAMKLDELDEVDRALFDEHPQSVVFDLSHAAANDAIRLSTDSPRFDADVMLDLLATQSALQQTYRFDLRFTSGRPDRINVFATEPLPPDVRWIDCESGASLAADRMPTDHPLRLRFPRGGELWQIRLLKPNVDRVQIEASAASPTAPTNKIPLLSVCGAESQRGHVFLRTDPGITFFHDASRLLHAKISVAAPNVPAAADERAVRSALQYAPAECELPNFQPRLALHTAARADAELIVFQRVEVESIYNTDGAAGHRAKLRLENRGATHLDLELEPGVRVERVEVAGRSLSISTDGNGAHISLPLPQQPTSLHVELILQQTGKALRTGQALPFPIAAMPSPLLWGEWSIRCSNEFVLVGSMSDPSAAGCDWRRRLFGPLARLSQTDALDERPATSERDVPPAGAIVFADWQSTKIPFVGQLPTGMLLAHRSATAAWSWLVFLVSFLVGVLVRALPRSFIGLAATAALLSLLLPAPHFPIATASFLGFIASLSFIMPRAASAGVATITWLRWARPMGTAWSCLACFVVARTLVAHQPEPILPLYSVLIPVDGQGFTVGDKLYLEEPFLRELHRLELAAENHGRDWLLRDAAYQLRVEESRDGPGVLPSASTATFEMEVFARNTEIVLPLRRADAQWGEITLDGLRTSIDWRSTDSQATIHVAEPGRYTLTVGLVPKMQDVAGKRHVRLRVPPIRGARFRLDHPAGLAGVMVRGAALATAAPATISPGSLTGGCDGSNELAISWPRQDASLAEAREIHLAQLHWLKLSDDGAILDAKYVVDGPLRPAALTLVIDPAWELLTSNDVQSTAALETDADGRQSLRIALTDDVDQRCQVELRFLLRGAIVPGILRLPPIETASLPVAERWFAVSAAPNFEPQVTSPDSVPRAAEEFLTEWHGDNRFTSGQGLSQRPANSAPQTTLLLDAKSPNPSIAFRPRPADSAIQDALHVAVERHAWRLYYRAQISPRDKHQFQLSLNVPVELDVESVVIERENDSVALRWSRNSASELTVFMGERIDQAFRLVVAGRVPRGSTSAVLPVIALGDRPAVPLALSLYRTDDILVGAAALTPLTQTSSSADTPPADWNAWPVGKFQLAPTRFVDTPLEIAEPAIAGDTPARTSELERAESPIPAREESPDAVPANVRLAETIVIQDANGRALFVTRLVVLPLTTSQCEIHLPAGHVHVELKLNGESIVSEPMASNRLVFPLGAPGLPQIVDVVTLGPPIDASRQQEFEQPRLFVNVRPLPVEMTLWSVGRVPAAERPKIDDAISISAGELAALRLDRLISIVEAATPPSTSLKRPELLDWSRDWSLRFAKLQQMGSLNPARRAPYSQDPSLVRDAADEQLADAWNRIAIWRNLVAVDANESTQQDRPALIDVVETVAPFYRPGEAWAHVAASGPVESIRVNPVRNQHLLASRPFVLLVFVCLAAAAIWTAGKPRYANLFSRNPQAIGVAAGIVWLLWLQPAWLGWLIIAVAAFAWFQAGHASNELI